MVSVHVGLGPLTPVPVYVVVVVLPSAPVETSVFVPVPSALPVTVSTVLLPSGWLTEEV